MATTENKTTFTKPLDLDPVTYPTSIGPYDPYLDDVTGEKDGPSWGLIIPIIMIGFFLLCVVLCLYWHKWRDKRSLNIPQGVSNMSSFHRSYRGGKASLRGFDAVRGSDRSTTPLRSSINERLANANVIPLHRSDGSGKGPYYWGQDQWKTSYPTPPLTGSTRRLSGKGKPLSPINEIDSPSSMVQSEFEFTNYDLPPQPPFSPYHLTWNASGNGPAPYASSDSVSLSQWSTGPKDSAAAAIPPSGLYPRDPFQGYQPANTSPFFPNHNTPTECEPDADSEYFRSQGHDTATNPSSQFTSYPSSPNRSNTEFSASTEASTNATSHGTSYPDSVSHGTSYPTTASNALTSYTSRQTSMNLSARTSMTDNPGAFSLSLPSSIMKYHQTVVDDPNNNSIAVPGSCLPHPLPKSLNYTLASSLVSSDTHYSDNTSMLPNIDSNSTIGFQYSRSFPVSTEQSGNVSPEDLSKLVDEMSSIRPVEEMSSTRPNSSMDPASRMISTSGTNALHRSWSVVAEISPASSKVTSGRLTSHTDNSLSWDSYQLNAGSGASRSYPDIPLHLESLAYRAHPSRERFQTPVLVDKQYWV